MAIPLAVSASREYLAEIRDTLDEPMPGLDVDWQSSDPSVVKIARSGGTTDYYGRAEALIRATGLGEALVTATVPGTGVSASTQVRVVRPLRNVMEVVAGYNHNCVVTDKQEVLCWGWDGASAVNSGGGETQSAPGFVSVIGSGSTLMAGYKDSCVVDTDGGASCWRTYDGASTTAMENLDGGITSLSLGKYHSCAVMMGGAVKCWGENENGQLGDGTTVPTSNIVDVLGLPGPQVSVAVGTHHTCSLSEARAIYCWGSNYWGNLGSAGANKGEPTPIDGRNDDYVAVDAGNSLTCGLRKNGRVNCWGWGLHLSDVEDHDPHDMGVESARDLSVGVEHMCAVDGEGDLRCWGESSWSRRGYPIEYPLRSSEKFVQVAAGNKHTCALTENGKVMCVGSNWEGQIGDGVPRNVRDDLVYVVKPDE